MEAYRLDECIAPLEQLFLSISRTYVQMVREKSSIGDDEDKEKVLYTLGYVVLETIKLLGIIAPFLSEAMYLNLKTEFKLKEKSVSHFSWPAFDPEKIDAQLELHLDAAQEIIQATLSPQYLQYLWVKNLQDNQNVTYVATEANMPLFKSVEGAYKIGARPVKTGE